MKQFTEYNTVTEKVWFYRDPIPTIATALVSIESSKSDHCLHGLTIYLLIVMPLKKVPLNKIFLLKHYMFGVTEDIYLDCL